ncbi:MAG: hypothetical protein FVQ79_02350 [Planctomycetes bacterium]|nr:hypothetical protein [Planctomycetota bacterium]
MSLKKNSIVFLINLFIYLIFRVIATRYGCTISSYLPNPDSGLLIDVVMQEDFLSYWQLLIWPGFALIIGVINGYFFGAAKQKWLYLFVAFFLGIFVVSCFDNLADYFFKHGTIGLLSWRSGFKGKINLSFVSVCLWPIVYLLTLAFIRKFRRKIREK